MKILIDEVNPVPPTPQYPWVGKHVTNHTAVVLFTAPGTGFCLYSTHAGNEESRYFEKWAESLFVPCSITLSSLKDHL